MKDPNEEPSGAPRVGQHPPREADPARESPDERDDAETPRREAATMTLRGAPVTIVLLLVNTAIELVFQTDPSLRNWATAHYAFGMLYDHGQLYASIEGVQLVSHAFLHGFFLHLGLNMAALAAFGPPVERSVGSLTYLLLYLAAAAAGALTHYGWLAASIALGFPPYEGALQILVGASGAISGVLALELRRRDLLMSMATGRPFGAYLRQVSIMFILLNAAVSLAPGFISGEAHIGGFLVGLILGPLVLRRPML